MSVRLSKIGYAAALILAPGAYTQPDQGGYVITSSDQEINVQAAAVIGKQVECQAPFGKQTVYGLDANGYLWVLEKDLRRRSLLSPANIMAFEEERLATFNKIMDARVALLAAKNLDPIFRRQLEASKLKFSTPHAVRRVQVATRPAEPSAPDKELRRLSRALDHARNTAIQAGLRNTFFTSVLNCAYDLSRLPATVSDPRTRKTIVFRKASVPVAAAWSSYEHVPLFAIMENPSLGELEPVELPQ